VTDKLGASCIVELVLAAVVTELDERIEVREVMIAEVIEFTIASEVLCV
jgi:hypothetical protein